MNDEIRFLIEKRKLLRSQGQYTEADTIRSQLVRLGYIVQDMNGDDTEITKRKNSSSLSPHIVLFGSGELSPTSQKIHERFLRSIGHKPVTIAIITAPAGFQPNVMAVYGEYVEFFKLRLQNYHPNVILIPANTREDANNPDIIAPLKDADYIVTGAGSPSYTVNVLQKSLLFEKIVQKMNEGTSLCLSSAAVLACSTYCLPVYEIFKVGEPLHWKPGLNLYAKFHSGPLTVIPHFNNTEGGTKTDTSCCFMGKERFRKLRDLLPEQESVWGIDEHTAVIFDRQSCSYTVSGKGTLHQQV